VVLGAIAAVVLGVVIFVLLPQPEIADVPAVQATQQEQPSEEPPAVAPVTPTTETQAEPTQTPEIVAEAPEPQQEPQVPQFDTFRVEPDGSMVIAGRAEPGQVVDVILAGAAIDRVTADAAGNFVALPTAGPSEQPRRLSLLADPEGAAIASTTSYIVAPIAAPVIVAEEPVPQALPEVAEIPAEAPQGVAGAEIADTLPPVAEAPLAPQVDIVATAPTPVPTPPTPPTVLRADADGVRVVQGTPALDTPQAEDDVALDAITYDPDGTVQLSGRAAGDGAVQVYIDNEPVTASPVTEGGDWRIDLPAIDTGVYTLRIDEVDGAGDVVSRLETPFKREEPQEVAAVLAEETSREGFEVAVRTVQPGATLWAIAEENLGKGIFYVEVFEANRNLIRDPDLIYPGQIFRIPEINQ